MIPVRPGDGHSPEYLSEEEAARLWRRAAQLQADAALRAEQAEADERLALRPGGNAADEATGYALEHVRVAAVEAGIGSEYLDAALDDLQAERSISATRRGGEITRRLLGDPPDMITVRRVVQATPAGVLKAMEDVLPKEPFSLNLIDRRGDPLNGGQLVFDISGAGFTISEGFAGQASMADLRQVYTSIRPIGEDGAASELTLRGPVAWAQRLNAAGGFAMTGIGGAVGFGLSWKLGGALAGSLIAGGVVAIPVAAAIAAAATAAGTLGALGGSVVGFRALYAYGLDLGRKGLETAVSAVAVEAQGGWRLGASEREME
jgi:hypothetical protein